ncbi:MAG: sulfite exporter TauE/SafE family protein [Fimbriimonadaceae bacterium]|nr:sulfite exporter TauE/SafE family protein [Fimbriimonadaceae bacterium]
MHDPALFADWSHYLLPFAILCGAAFVQGVTGFAFGILSMAGLTLLWEPQPANVVVTLLTVFSTLGTLYSVRHGMRWLRLRPLLLGIAVGMPLGVQVMVLPGSGPALRGLVAIACLLVAWQNWAPRAAEPGCERCAPRWLGLGSGLASGFFSGSVSSGGPPILWYVYRQPWSRDELKATTLAIFFVATAYKLGMWLVMAAAGAGTLLTWSRVQMAGSLLPAVLLGTTIGIRVFARIDRDQLRRIVCVLLVVMAAAIVATI